MISKTVLGFIGKNPLDVEMRFDPAAPLEVRFVFENSVEWFFARDLLVTGSTRAAGEGDVRIAPADGELVRITLDSPFGNADIDLARNDVAAFLNDTFVEFPMFRESEFIQEALVAAFINELGATE